jgi:hypothetical protein
MTTIIDRGWAYQVNKQLTVAVPVNLTGSYCFPLLDEARLKVLQEYRTK